MQNRRYTKMKRVIKNVRLYGNLTDITVENGKISEIGKTEEAGTDFKGAKIYPGLIDVHSHGCMGMEANDADLEMMARYMLQHGTTTWYPSTSTVSASDIVKACHANTEISGGANIPGFHLEGPFINPDYKGAQNGKYVIAPSLELFERCGGIDKVKKITVAPEVDGAIDFIKTCPAVVSIGHTAADYETAKAAFEAGASSLTHTFNRMPPMLHRDPGPIPAGAEAGAYAEVICDGVHVHPAMVRSLIKLYGEDRIIFISDSISSAGLPDGKYELGGIAVIVRDGQPYTEGGALAGSSVTLLHCVRCAVKFGIPESAAFKFATENPARQMGLNKGKIEVGYDADFIIVDDELNLIKAIARGEF